MYCPNCLTQAIAVRRLNKAGYDPLMTEWECQNSMCKTTFYVTTPPYEPPVMKRDRAIKAGQGELIKS